MRREEERYRTLVTATSQIVWSAAPDGAFTAEVPAWSELTGQSAAEQSGFGARDQLTRAFKARYGMTIADYAEQAGRGHAPAPIENAGERSA